MIFTAEPPLIQRRLRLLQNEGGIKLTYKDLCNEITALGFETELESEERVLKAANRALMTIFTERPLYKKLTMFKSKLTPTIQIRTVSHVGGEDITIKYEGAKSYSFTTYGTGRCFVQGGSPIKTVDFSEEGEIHRGFLNGSGFLRFVGEYSYTVLDLAIFSETFSEKAEDIPTLSDFREYEMKKCCSDFLAFISPPTDEYGMTIEGATLKGGIMSIPESYSGKINLVYKSAPQKLTGNLDEEIILPSGCEHLPALLASAYVWLDDEDDKAQYYMSLYREAMSAVKYYDRESFDNKYYNVNGWA